jgi:hypothetical protein
VAQGRVPELTLDKDHHGLVRIRYNVRTAGEPATVLEDDQQGVKMIHRARWLCATLAAAAFVAACGGGGHSSSTSSTTTTKVAHTTTSRTTTSTRSTKSTTNSGATNPASNKATVLADCKAEAKTISTTFASFLPANYRPDINAVCEKVAAGDVNGAKAIGRALCNQIAARMPTGQAKSAVESACKSL